MFVSTANWPKLLKSLPALKDQVRTVVYWGKDGINEDVSSLFLEAPSATS